MPEHKTWFGLVKIGFCWGRVPGKGGSTSTMLTTMGWPIGPLNVPENVRVLSFEATEDLIAGAEGIPNPHRPNWTTICQDSAKLANGVVRPEMTPSTAHNANRYGAMAAKKPSISSAGALNVKLIESGWGLKPW